MGFNYRMSNLLAAVGRASWPISSDGSSGGATTAPSTARRSATCPGCGSCPRAPSSRTMFWLTTFTVDPEAAGADREAIRLHLETLDIEARPAWKPMHLQPLYADAEVFGGAVSARLFEHGLCIPSGSSLTDDATHPNRRGDPRAFQHDPTATGRTPATRRGYAGRAISVSRSAASMSFRLIPSTKRMASR